jgi:hypothetical protein
VDFYEAFARSAYRRAANHAGHGSETRDLLGLLAETLPLARRSLNLMTERCLF